eukprot:TRINITY_DN411_c0_g1_i1.p1 TRINITY_DN411_c0_g1~~TRINITY_DN411_c0_g1_i1.p1  ORF type:complete len:195 (-),score=39.52 TRINITY_DN411_c0_g1_i1:67-651(-)
MNVLINSVLAASAGQKDVVEYLLREELRAEVDIRDLEKHTPLMLACGTTQETEGYIETVKHLIQQGANVDATDDGGFSPIHLSVSNGNLGITQLLLEAGCLVNTQNSYSWTPLHIACDKGHKGLIALLIQNGAHLGVKDARGKTPEDLARNAGIKVEVKAEVNDAGQNVGVLDEDEVLMNRIQQDLPQLAVSQV